MADFNSSQAIATSPFHIHLEAWGLGYKMTQVIKMKRNLNGTSGKRFAEEESLSGDLEDELVLTDHCNTNLQYSVLFKMQYQYIYWYKILFQKSSSPCAQPFWLSAAPPHLPVYHFPDPLPTALSRPSLSLSSYSLLFCPYHIASPSYPPASQEG